MTPKDRPDPVIQQYFENILNADMSSYQGGSNGPGNPIDSGIFSNLNIWTGFDQGIAAQCPVYMYRANMYLEKVLTFLTPFQAT
jgi:hypothetical protein